MQSAAAYSSFDSYVFFLQAEMMINEIRDAFKRNLPFLKWMDPDTRKLAKEKVSTSWFSRRSENVSPNATRKLLPITVKIPGAT